jgi:hypothetical protein
MSSAVFIIPGGNFCKIYSKKFTVKKLKRGSTQDPKSRVLSPMKSLFLRCSPGPWQATAGLHQTNAAWPGASNVQMVSYAARL